MYLHDRLMDLSQKTECMDVILHNEFKNDYPYRENLHDVTFLIGELIDILQQSSKICFLQKESLLLSKDIFRLV